MSDVIKMRKNIIKFFSIIILIVSIVSVNVGQFADIFVVSAEENNDRKIINVGFFAFDGYHMIDENGERSGYGYDFVRLISRYLDVDFEYTGYDKSWNEMFEMLENGEVDMITSVQQTPQRCEKFAFSKPIGTSSAMLTVKIDNSTIIASDYISYDGIKIGMLEGNSRNSDLQEYAVEKGFSYNPVYYNNVKLLKTALQTGEVDAVLTSTLRKTENERIIDKFATHDFYAMVRKDNSQLLEKINYAIDQLNAAEGDWQNILKNKYYTHLEDRNLTFTESEKEVIRQYAEGEKTLVMTASHDRAPYSYVEDGELKGIIPEYFEKLAKYIGIPYEVRVPTSREEYQQWRTDCVVDGTMDARIDSMTFVEDNSYSVSGAYTVMRLAMVTRRDFNGNIKKLAVATAQGLFGIEDGLAPEAKRIEMPSREAAMQAVLDGKADAAVVYLYTAQQFVNRDERGLLTYTLLDEPTYDYCVAFTPNVSHELSGIFTKAIYSMSDGTFENIASKYTTYKAENIDMITWIRIYPMYSILICTVFFLLCLFVVMFCARRKRIQTLKKLVKKADDANKAKSEFLANISHDIRTPMNAIVGLSSLIEQEDDTSDKMKDNIKKIRCSCEHLLGIINDVLDMSKIETSDVSLHEVSFDLIKKIEQTEDIIRFQSDEKNQTFNVHFKNIHHTMLIADSSRLSQILINVLSNAVKYTQNDGNIEFDIEELVSEDSEKAKFKFTVTDTGCGMSKEYLEHIFEPFSRAEVSSTNHVQGTGLGMAITKSIVELMQGQISIDSQLNKGTCIEITLSMKIDKSEINKSESRKNYTLDGMKILCAEDNELNAEILKATLELYNVSCTVCGNGEELVNIFENSENKEYDAILTDIQMPVMNGIDAAKAIRNSSKLYGKSIPIIAVTANAFTDDIEKSGDNVIDARITKPIDMKLLVQTLENFRDK